MNNTTSAKLNKYAEILAGVMEALHWSAAASMVALGICAAVSWDWLDGIFARINEPSLSTYGFEIVATQGRLESRAVWLFAIAAVVILALMALVCRNVRLILKRSRSASPFQRENVRMLREIGLFFLAIPVVSLAMSVLLRLLLGDAVEAATLDPTHFVMGIFMLCLSLAFDHGAALEADTEGLV